MISNTGKYLNIFKPPKIKSFQKASTDCAKYCYNFRLLSQASRRCSSEKRRSRAYAVRYFVGFTAAGVSVGLVAWLYEQGGFVTMLHAFAGLCLLVIAAAIILPTEIRVPAAEASQP
jgi:hypothetical protein